MHNGNTGIQSVTLNWPTY